MALENEINNVLQKTFLPNEQQNIIAQNIVSTPFISEGKAGKKIMLSITVPANLADSLEGWRAEIEKTLKALQGIESAMVALTAQRTASTSATNTPPPHNRPPPKQKKIVLENIKHIIAVASGKGGVGKSTTAINLALALRNQNLKVGILDADIYGPSMPRLFGINAKPEVKGKVLTPFVKYGIKVMSIGFLVAEASPIVWRGPMVMSALTQLLQEVAWGDLESPLDILIVDMPPGTGDAQLTMSQQVDLSGAIIVSTPQDLALIDARKGLHMFEKVSVPILGIVENMSGFICPKCGEPSDIFGKGGAKQQAEKLNVPFLGGIPLDINLRLASDAGTPIMHSQPTSHHATLYNNIAKQIIETLQQ